MKYWKNLLTDEVIESDIYPGLYWVEIFCTGLDPMQCNDPDCPVHGVENGDPK